MSGGVRRLAGAALRNVAPQVAGRRATDAFGTTRALGLHPDDVVPLGAHRFAVHDDPDVTGGYLWGDGGPAALLVHGWGTDSSSMHGLVPPLRALGFRAAAFDAPAHGVSAGSQATMTQFARATAAVLDTLDTPAGAGGGDRPVEAVVAHSLGSIAAVAALAEGHRVRAVRCLVLVAPACTLAGVLERWAQGTALLPRPVTDRMYQELWRRNGVPVRHWDVAALGRHLDVPTLVLHDPGDPVVPFREAEAVVAGLRRARLAAVPGAGHAGILTAPVVKDRVRAFVAEHAAEQVDGLAPAASGAGGDGG